MSDQLIHEAECPHPDCEAMLRVGDTTPAGVYRCNCKQIRVRLGWSTGINFVLTQEPKEPTP